MESRLPKPKPLNGGNNDRANRIAANRLKFGETFPRIPLTLVNTDNPPLYQSNRGRAVSPEPRQRNMNPERYTLRRSRSISDLTHSKILPLKRGATTILETNPAKSAKPNVVTTTGTGSTFKKPGIKSTAVTKPVIKPVAVSKQASTLGTSTSTSTKPVNKPVAVSKQASTLGTSTSTSTVNKGAAARSTAAKVAVKRIPAYDYKARFLDLTERHTVVKERLAQAESKIDDAERMEQALAAFQEENSDLRIVNESLQEQLDMQLNRNNEHESTIRSLRAQVKDLEKEKKEFLEQIATLSAENDTIRPALKKLEKTYAGIVEESCELKKNIYKSEELLFQSNMARKQLHNDLLDLKGNIRVFCRVRPSLDSEKGRAMCGWQYMDETSVEISLLDGPKKSQKHDFSFDQVFHPASSQQEVFELVSPLIQSAFDGYNICIFAYGQTGSGKTFTMEGTPTKTGIIPRTVDLLFSSVENYRLIGWVYSISVTFLEIYNEVLYDLLSNEQKDLDIRMVNQKTPHEIYVSNLTEFTVQSTDDLRELIEVANSHRATAATAGNERSSRSHAVTQIKLTGTHAQRGEKCIGKINLIDLAGSESPKTSNRMDETKNINRSLSELTNVIMALLNQNDHIPYRNSKLTHLLMPSLGGNSKTLMFINVAPFEECFKESVKSLRFAANVNACKLNKVRKNKVYVE